MRYPEEPFLDLGRMRDEIVSGVAKRHGITVTVMRSTTQCTEVARARWEAMYRLHEELGMSKSRIARYFGRDHTTVMHGIAKHAHIHHGGPMSKWDVNKLARKAVAKAVLTLRSVN